MSSKAGVGLVADRRPSSEAAPGPSAPAPADEPDGLGESR